MGQREGRGRLSNIDLLPEEADAVVAWANEKLRERSLPQTVIFTEFNERLADLGLEHISKSSFSRYAVRKAIQFRKLDEARRLASEVTTELGPEGSDQMTVLVGELLKLRLFELLEGKELTTKQAQEAGRTLQSVTGSQKTSADARRKLQQELRDAINKAIDKATRLATCWKITRADGAVEGYTSFDAPLEIDGVTYEPANGFTTSQLSADVEMSVADVEVLGAMDADGISADALLAGVYDHAEVEMFVVDWGDLTIPKTIVRRGWTGTITQAGQGFTVELRGLGQRIQQPVIDSYSAECRVHLFSPKCGVNRAAFAVNATVTALNDGSLGATSDNRIFYAAALVQDDGWFDYGELWWTTGASAGLKTEVRAFTSDGRVELWEPMGLDIEIGDQFTIHAGCDKRRETCSAKFNNIVNLRAEPDLPGQDAVTAYPDPKA
tara:strand:- start:9607 stop:10920 length:1314 start_codon:yes stop_codon:yes gene_type:complete